MSRTLREQVRRRRLVRAAVLFAGLIVPQLILLGPSLFGGKLFLPLDILTLPGIYVPVDAKNPPARPQNVMFSDVPYVLEPGRRFAAAEVRAGRLPLWNPDNYCGAPFLAANQGAVFSPYRALDYLWPGPGTVAVAQVAKSLVAGIGAFLYFRHALGASFAAAAAGAWCFPLGAFMIFWASFPLSAVLSWLPWILFATDLTVRRPAGGAPLGLALACAAMLLSGHLGLGVHVLVASAVHAAWRLGERFGARGLVTRAALSSALAVASGWGVGLLLAAPQILPTAEYVRSSARVADRQKGIVETPPMDAWTLRLLLLPHSGGSLASESTLLMPGNEAESPAAGYAGLLVALVAAPLGLAATRRRRFLPLWLAFAALGLAQAMDLPGLRTLLEQPPFASLRNNRLVFLVAWAILGAAVAGLDDLARAGWRWRPWMWAMPLAAGALAAWCLARRLHPQPELSGVPSGVLAWFALAHGQGLALALAAAGAWLAVPRDPAHRRAFGWLVAVLCVAELVWVLGRVNPHSDPSLYYPRIEMLEKLARGPAGRICGIRCLPPCLNQRHGLKDIRGFDAADPIRLVELLELARDERYEPSPWYARTMYFVPRPHPIIGMLNVRWFVGRGEPPEGAALSGPDYWATENRACGPRVFVPRSVVVANDKAARLARLGDRSFDPLAVAYVESPSALPPGPFAGEARIVAELPTAVTVDVRMQTAGLLVLADLWDPGWKARSLDSEYPVLPVNHALRGIWLPAGTRRIIFTYVPASFANGMLLMQLGLLALGAWVVARRIAGRV